MVFCSSLWVSQIFVSLKFTGSSPNMTNVCFGACAFVFLFKWCLFKTHIRLQKPSQHSQNWVQERDLCVHKQEATWAIRAGAWDGTISVCLQTSKGSTEINMLSAYTQPPEEPRETHFYIFWLPHSSPICIFHLQSSIWFWNLKLSILCTLKNQVWDCLGIGVGKGGRSCPLQHFKRSVSRLLFLALTGDKSYPRLFILPFL